MGDKNTTSNQKQAQRSNGIMKIITQSEEESSFKGFEGAYAQPPESDSDFLSKFTQLKLGERNNSAPFGTHPSPTSIPSFVPPPQNQQPNHSGLINYAIWGNGTNYQPANEENPSFPYNYSFYPQPPSQHNPPPTYHNQHQHNHHHHQHQQHNPHLNLQNGGQSHLLPREYTTGNNTMSGSNGFGYYTLFPVNGINHDHHVQQQQQQQQHQHHRPEPPTPSFGNSIFHHENSYKTVGQSFSLPNIVINNSPPSSSSSSQQSIKPISRNQQTTMPQPISRYSSYNAKSHHSPPPPSSSVIPFSTSPVQNNAHSPPQPFSIYHPQYNDDDEDEDDQLMIHSTTKLSPPQETPRHNYDHQISIEKNTQFKAASGNNMRNQNNHHHHHQRYQSSSLSSLSSLSSPSEDYKIDHHHHHSNDIFPVFSDDFENAKLNGNNNGSGGSNSGGFGLNSKNPESQESSNSKLQFRQFYKAFKSKEKEGFEEAKNFALEYIKTITDNSQWKVYLELADLAKRENKISEARNFYRIVNTIQPLASQGWIEHAKMEEEFGELIECQNILKKGLEYCPSNESLLIKCLKHYERMEQFTEARSLLGMLRGMPIEKTWRTIMEGGLLEARQGNNNVTRIVFKFLIKNLPWYGPIYLEACRFEERCEEIDRAMSLVTKGLHENPRYGPLWFSALRIHEKHHLSSPSAQFNTTISEIIEKAARLISKELIWKLHFEGAQIAERTGDIRQARSFYVKAVTHCPENLLWKVWLGGAKTELNQGNIMIARKLLKKALHEVPSKMKPMVLLEYSRLEEYAGKYEKARGILSKAKQTTKYEWKIFLESILLEIRTNNMESALSEANEALKIHSGTGRLWAILIQLKHAESYENQLEVFKNAMNEVPKSGEVWCEGAKIALQLGFYAAARQYINFAIQFTPQYGDSFIEYLRLELLENGENADIEKVELACVKADPNYGALWLYFKRHPLDSTRQVLRCALLELKKNTPAGVPLLNSLSVNNIYKNIHEKTDEERRKAIFL